MLSMMLLDLSLQDILSDIPRDAGAIVVYVLFAVFIGMIWAGNRKRTSAGNRPDDL